MQQLYIIIVNHWKQENLKEFKELIPTGFKYKHFNLIQTFWKIWHRSIHLRIKNFASLLRQIDVFSMRFFHRDEVPNLSFWNENYQHEEAFKIIDIHSFSHFHFYLDRDLNLNTYTFKTNTYKFEHI